MITQYRSPRRGQPHVRRFLHAFNLDEAKRSSLHADRRRIPCFTVANVEAGGVRPFPLLSLSHYHTFDSVPHGQ